MRESKNDYSHHIRVGVHMQWSVGRPMLRDWLYRLQICASI
jgi:hypothetical protein